MALTATAHQPTIRGTTRLIGLLGDPVGHSLSPAMHNAALGSIGFDAVYVALPVRPADLATAIDGLKAINFLGANVTLPHKSAVFALFKERGYELSQLARTLGAVNTIVHREDGTLYGDTTDAAGFMAAFEDHHTSFNDKSVALLGNGGSARSIGLGLSLARKIKRLTVVGRDVTKAAALAEEIRAVARNVEVSAVSFENYSGIRSSHDVVVNTTPIGMHPNVEATPVPAELLEPGQIIYDIVYNPLETRLLREARSRGCAVVDGLGMLVYQGKIAFELWTGRNLEAKVFYEGITRQHASTTRGQT